MREKRLDNVFTETGYVSVWYDGKDNKPISILFYPDEDEDKFVEILIKNIPQLLSEIERVTK